MILIQLVIIIYKNNNEFLFGLYDEINDNNHKLTDLNGDINELIINNLGNHTNYPETDHSVESLNHNYGYNNDSWAALKEDGSVITWGDAKSGGDKIVMFSTNFHHENNYDVPDSELLSADIVKIVSTSNHFAALKKNGSVVTWGYVSHSSWIYPKLGPNGLPTDSTNVQSDLLSNVSNIYSNSGAFAALKNDGSVVTWGNFYIGGERVVRHIGSDGYDLLDDSGNPIKTDVSGKLTNVVKIIANKQAFAALKNDGSVVTWGNSRKGGAKKIKYYDDSKDVDVSSDLISGVVDIFTTWETFAALKNDGSVVTWGNMRFGGHKMITYDDENDSRNLDISSGLNSGVFTIYSNARSFAALKENGNVITWGLYDWGGEQKIKYSEETNDVDVSSDLTSGVVRIFSTRWAYAALKEDGNVITWGNSRKGGLKKVIFNSSDDDSNNIDVSSKLTSDIVTIYSNHEAFAALKKDGSVVTWGNSSYGGDSSSVDLTNVKKIFNSYNAFAALKTDNSVVTWGDATGGGDSSSVDLSKDIKNIYSNGMVFVAHKFNGGLITWGNSNYGGDQKILYHEDDPRVDEDISTNLTSGVLKIFPLAVRNLSGYAKFHKSYGPPKTAQIIGAPISPPRLLLMLQMRIFSILRQILFFPQN